MSELGEKQSIILQSTLLPPALNQMEQQQLLFVCRPVIKEFIRLNHSEYFYS